VQACEGGWRWFGLKVHARNLSLDADLEMHALHKGYLGLTRLKDAEVNVCGLFRRPCMSEDEDSRRLDNPNPRNPALKSASLLTAIQEGGTPALRERLERAVFDESSFCSVAGLRLQPQRAEHLSECCLGDALTMIPPVTGNGMSMAFEAAEMAVEPLRAWSHGELSWRAARRAIAASCDLLFHRRLLWARFLQWMMFTPILRGRLVAVPLGSALVWRVMFGRTR
jgi:2-polyprenyl-6-methoxyphenol hydroxylase-like FAD-dependent oxidoreductase